MAYYRFVTTWNLDAPIERVFDALVHSEKWPQWWRGVTQVVELDDGGADHIGNRRRYTFRSRLPYRLTFEMELMELVQPTRLVGRATGELIGTGTWELTPTGAGGTTARYTWEVRTSRRWMNALAPLLRPLFVYNHDWVMARGHEGIRKLLG